MRKTEPPGKGGDDEGDPPPRVHRRGPSRLNAALAASAGGLSGKQHARMIRLVANWRDIAGPSLATHTAPLSLTQPKSGAPGTLTLRADGGAALLVQHHTREILAKVNTVLGPGAAGSIKLVQGAIPRPSFGPKPANPVLPRADEARVAESVAAVKDEQLRARLHSLMRRALADTKRR